MATTSSEVRDIKSKIAKCIGKLDDLVAEQIMSEQQPMALRKDAQTTTSFAVRSPQTGNEQTRNSHGVAVSCSTS